MRVYLYTEFSMKIYFCLFCVGYFPTASYCRNLQVYLKWSRGLLRQSEIELFPNIVLGNWGGGEKRKRNALLIFRSIQPCFNLNSMHKIRQNQMQMYTNAPVRRKQTRVLCIQGLDSDQFLSRVRGKGRISEGWGLAFESMSSLIFIRSWLQIRQLWLWDNLKASTICSGTLIDIWRGQVKCTTAKHRT